MKIIFIVILCLAFGCQLMNAAGHENHKLRHFKHKIVHINDRHVNEIREAFEDYKKTVKKNNNANLDRGRDNENEFDDNLTQDASDDSIYANEIVYESRPKILTKLTSTRHKRVHTTESTTTMKSLSYDEEYNDDEEEQVTTHPTKSTSDGVKLHVS